MTIKVIDNFLPEDVHMEIFRHLYQGSKWSFTGGNISRFWHVDNLEKESYYNDFLWNTYIKPLAPNGYTPDRIYANGQTAGQSGELHTDGGDLTVLYYPNPSWNVSFGGSLSFVKLFDNERDHEIFKTVAYKANRCVIFPAKTPHIAEAPTREFGEVRISLAFKLYKEGKTPIPGRYI